VPVPRFAVYLFDIDGTLVDSAPDICGAMREVLASTKAPQLSDEYLRGFIGYHLRDLFIDLFPDITPDEMEGLIVNYRRCYPLREHNSTTLYPGVAEVLSRLPGRKSTATTKSTETARIILTKFGLLPYFDHVQGTDGFPAKPEPDVILRSIEVFGVKPEDCLLVGDAAPDMEAGRRAGVATCAVTYGYGNHEAMRRHQPDYWISNLTELAG